MSLRSAALSFLALSAFAFSGSPFAQAVVLVGDPFIHSYTGWVDAHPDRLNGSNWRLSHHNPTLMETHTANPPSTGGGTNTGLHEPNVLIQDGFTAPGTYDLTATMRTNDDDLLGLVWNYLDNNNYFRVGIRQQPSSGTFGATEGLSVQKVVGGVVTQLYPATPMATPSPITQTMIDNRTPFDLRVAVDGNSFNIFFNGVPQLPGGNSLSDPDLAAGRKIGFQSWAQVNDTANHPVWGTEVDSVSVSDSSGTLYTETFDRRPVSWRALAMTNANNVSLSASNQGNFGLDINDPWIYQQSNGFLFATANNTDFIGPAIVVNEPGSENFKDYEMRVRLSAADNDGMGVLVRVQDDDTFYRINFTNEPMGAGITRAPRGLSVQKVQDGVWTELFRDDQDNPLFVNNHAPEPNSQAAVPTPNSPMLDANGNPAFFDLIVRAVGNGITVQVTDPMGNVFNYEPIFDNDNPLLTGTVGLHTWGNVHTYYTSYGGEPGALLTFIPEPASATLLLLAAAGSLMIGRRR